MARHNYSGEKRRRELNKKRKQERKRREKAERSESGSEDDTSYLEYLNPGGPQDGTFIEDEEDDEEDQDEGAEVDSDLQR